MFVIVPRHLGKYRVTLEEQKNLLKTKKPQRETGGQCVELRIFHLILSCVD